MGLEPKARAASDARRLTSFGRGGKGPFGGPERAGLLERFPNLIGGGVKNPEELVIGERTGGGFRLGDDPWPPSVTGFLSKISCGMVMGGPTENFTFLAESGVVEIVARRSPLRDIEP